MQFFSFDTLTSVLGHVWRRSAYAVVLSTTIVFAGGNSIGHATDQQTDAELIEVDQVIDASAGDVSLMFQFKPTLLRVKAGQKVRFLNSRGQHSVVSIKRMWPEGVPHINLTNLAAADITFNKPGVYGLTCKVHGRFGMVMLIAVGEELSNLAEARKGMPSGRAGKRMRELMKELDNSQ